MLHINGKRYNLHGFNHPGGNEILKLCEGEPDCTALFESYHTFCDKDKIRLMMRNMEVSEISSCDTTLSSMFSFESTGFYATLQRRVVAHFERKHKRTIRRSDVKSNWDWAHTVCLLCMLFLLCQFQLLFGTYWHIRCICSLVSGISLAGLGFNVLHDAGHYALSTNPTSNQRLSYVICGLLLWNHMLWAYHHAVRHHQYTGNFEYDPDLVHLMPFVRKTTKSQAHWLFTVSRSWFAFKFLLGNTLFPGAAYGISMAHFIIWVPTGTLWKMKLPEHFRIFEKANVGQYVISALFHCVMCWYGGTYMLLHIIGANVTVFLGIAPDHDLFPTHLETEKLNLTKPIDWGEMQVRSSANFCNRYRAFTKFMGCINFQIEHHLFPSVCNHHLPEIAPIVKHTCDEFHIPYQHIDRPWSVWDSLLATYYDVLDEEKST
jgi:linoleoyl-CoA desaturase